MKKTFLIAIATITFSTSVLAHTLKVTNITNQCACKADTSNGTYTCEKTTEHSADIVFASGADDMGECTFKNSEAISPNATSNISDVKCDNSNQPIFEAKVLNSNSATSVYTSYQDLEGPSSLVAVPTRFHGEYIPVAFNSAWIDTNTCTYTGPVS